MGTGKRRSYTKEQREAVVADVRASGVNEAARKHGVPQSCVSRWAKSGGVARVVGGASGPAVTARKGRGGSQSASKAAHTPAEANRAATSAAPVEAVARSRVAKVYTPSQKAEVIDEYAATHGV
jgi:transposase-like protein